VQLAFAALHDGDPAEASRLRAAACRRIDALSDEWIVDRVSIAYYLATGEHHLEYDRDAVRHLERALTAAHETGKTFILAPAGAALAQAKLRLGRIAEAADAATDAVDAARLTGNRQSLSQALAAYARALLASGDVRGAVPAAQESVRVAGEVERSAFSTASGLALGAALLEAGLPSEAVAAVRSTAGLPLVPGTTGCEAHELLVRAALATGRHDDANRWAERAVATAERVQLPVARAQAWRARALVALDAGDARAAAEAALAAAASADEVGAVLEAARSRLLAGTAMGHAGDRPGAVGVLRLAQAALDAAGARRLRDACDRELRRLGERVHRRAVHGAGEALDGLSSREREIALLVRDRKTNREIAAELFLSEKTVESHLRNLFGKLGVSSRRDVAAAIERSAGRP
jgi:DNA-binding NarL/FixJ family response regulator